MKLKRSITENKVVQGGLLDPPKYVYIMDMLAS